MLEENIWDGNVKTSEHTYNLIQRIPIDLYNYIIVKNKKIESITRGWG